MRAVGVYEQALGRHEVEVESKTRWLLETLGELRELGAAIRSAAVKLRLTGVPFVNEAVAALKRVDELWKGQSQGRER